MCFQVTYGNDGFNTEVSGGLLNKPEITEKHLDTGEAGISTGLHSDEAIYAYSKSELDPVFEQ